MDGAGGLNLNIYRKIRQSITSDRHEKQLIVSRPPYAEIEQLSPLHSLSGMLAHCKRLNFMIVLLLASYLDRFLRVYSIAPYFDY